MPKASRGRLPYDPIGRRGDAFPRHRGRSAGVQNFNTTRLTLYERKPHSDHNIILVTLKMADLESTP